MANNDSTVFNKNMIIIIIMTIMMMMMTMIIIARSIIMIMINSLTYRISPLFLAVLQCLDTFWASLVTIGCHGYEI